MSDVQDDSDFISSPVEPGNEESDAEEDQKMVEKSPESIETPLFRDEDNSTPGILGDLLLSPIQVAKMKNFTLVAVNTARGDTVWIIDTEKNIDKYTCGSEHLHLIPYEPDAACDDACADLPSVHVLPSGIARALHSSALKGDISGRYIAGFVLVGEVSVQVYYRKYNDCLTDTEMVNKVFRKAVNKEGELQILPLDGSKLDEQISPYALIDYNVLCKQHSEIPVRVISCVPQANVALVDSLCRLAYSKFHEEEDSLADNLYDYLCDFMKIHSHFMKGKLDQQMNGVGCEDPYARKQRRHGIDKGVHLMLMVGEIIGNIHDQVNDLKSVLRDLQQLSPEIKIEKPPKTVRIDCESSE